MSWSISIGPKPPGEFLASAATVTASGQSGPLAQAQQRLAREVLDQAGRMAVELGATSISAGARGHAVEDESTRRLAGTFDSIGIDLTWSYQPVEEEGA